jgi:hypothetical protein
MTSSSSQRKHYQDGKEKILTARMPIIRFPVRERQSSSFREEGGRQALNLEIGR